MEKIQKTFEERLKAKGYRFTGQRRAILNCIINNQDDHLSSEEIHYLVKEDFPEIGLATVYRTLLLFEKIELIHKIDFDDGKNRYELNKNNDLHLHHHHHLICTKCGMISEVKEDLLGQLEDEIFKKSGFLIKNHSVKFYGTCSDCLKLEEKTQ